GGQADQGGGPATRLAAGDAGRPAVAGAKSLGAARGPARADTGRRPGGGLVRRGGGGRGAGAAGRFHGAGRGGVRGGAGAGRRGGPGPRRRPNGRSAEKHVTYQAEGRHGGGAGGGRV